MNDPVAQIEDRKGQHDLGVLGYRIYEGARHEGASRIDALMVVAGFYLSGHRNNDTDESQ